MRFPCSGVNASATSRIRPSGIPAPWSRSRASATAATGSLPGFGMIPGSSTGSIASIVATSSDSGVTTCASPAHASSAV